MEDIIHDQNKDIVQAHFWFPKYKQCKLIFKSTTLILNHASYVFPLLRLLRTQKTFAGRYHPRDTDRNRSNVSIYGTVDNASLLNSLLNSRYFQKKGY